MNPHSILYALRAVILFATAVSLTGCVTQGSSSAAQRSEIYFSHSIASSERPQLYKKSTAIETENEKSIGLHRASQITLHFDNDSAVVRGEDIERLQSFILSFDGFQLPVFLITGHTDSVHSDQYNIVLSDMRAKSTQRQMLRLGIPITQTALRGLGESNPIATNSSTDGRQLNRRVTVQAIQ